MEKPKKKPSNRKKWLIGIGLLSIVGCFIVFIYTAGLIADGLFKSDEIDLRGEEAREFIESGSYGLPLPTNAQDIYVRYIHWQDFQEFIRFSASPESVEAWLNGHDFCFTELTANLDSGASFSGNLEWWTPNASPLSIGSETCGSFPYYKITIDQNNPELWIVYLVIFST